MHDDKRPSPSILLSLALALALVPACDDGDEPAAAVEFRSEACPDGWTLYGESVGGFCCSGATDGYGCGSTVCALDIDQSQGNRMCSSYECPTGWSLYGESVGGFCCSGSTDGASCSGSVCALDPAQSQGNPGCAEVSDLCPAEKLERSGMCCAADGTQCEVPQCPVDPDGEVSGYYVCLSSSFDLPLDASETGCEFHAAGASGLKLTPDAYWQTHTSSVRVTACGDAVVDKVFVYDGDGQTSDTNVFDGGTVGNLYPWIQNDARSLWISPTDRYVCLVHEESSEYRTCVPPSNQVHNLAPDFGDQVEYIEAHPNWLGVGADLWEHPDAVGQWIYVSADEDLDYRPIVTNGQWTSWHHAVSSFKFHAL